MDPEKRFNSLFWRHRLPLANVSLVGFLNALEDANDLLHTHYSRPKPRECPWSPVIESWRNADLQFQVPEAGVAALSGTAFGEFGEGYLRLSYANSLENLLDAVGRIKGFLACNVPR